MAVVLRKQDYIRYNNNQMLRLDESLNHRMAEEMCRNDEVYADVDRRRANVAVDANSIQLYIAILYSEIMIR